MPELSTLQKQTAHAIVNIFETGRVLGDYARVTVLQGDSGHLTYGRSQTTLGSGNLALLLQAYVEANGEFAGELETWLPRFEQRDLSLDFDERVKQVLRDAGGDPIMQRVQDAFFDRAYWEPAVRRCDRLSLETALGVSVIYDGTVHGSVKAMADRTTERHGATRDVGEEVWIERYVDTRRDWLANHQNELLHKTVYRMDAFKSIIDDGNWALGLPLVVRGSVISEATLNDEHTSPHPAAAEGVEDRVLFLTNPFLRGPDVRALQDALRSALGGDEPVPDGVFGPNTDKHVRQFQADKGLTVDGKVGRATWALLQEV